MEAYVHGVSTCNVDDLVAALGVESEISKSQVSRICAVLDTEIARFRERTLTHTCLPYIFLDATYCKVRIGAHVVSHARGGHRRGTHRSIQALEKDIRDWIRTWNENPRPFAWTKTADEILERLNAYLQQIPGA